MQSDMPDSPARTLITFLKAIVNVTFPEILISHYVVRGSHRNCRFAAITGLEVWQHAKSSKEILYQMGVTCYYERMALWVTLAE